MEQFLIKLLLIEDFLLCILYPESLIPLLYENYTVFFVFFVSIQFSYFFLFYCILYIILN